MEQKDNRRDTVRQRSSDGATQRRNKNRNYNNATSRERAKRNSDYGKDRTSRERGKSARYSDRAITRQKKSQNEPVAEKRRQREYKMDNLDYSYKDSPFFSKSSVNGNVRTRTNRADDFFENIFWKKLYNCERRKLYGNDEKGTCVRFSLMRGHVCFVAFPGAILYNTSIR